jgi:hypothetical protein
MCILNIKLGITNPSPPLLFFQTSCVCSHECCDFDFSKQLFAKITRLPRLLTIDAFFIKEDSLRAFATAMNSFGLRILLCLSSSSMTSVAKRALTKINERNKDWLE